MAFALFGLNTFMSDTAPADTRCFGEWYVGENVMIFDTFTVVGIVMALVVVAVLAVCRSG
jgi:hypothetical protein